MSSLRSRGRGAARAAADRVGRRTSSRRVLPTMLIVGGQRCGTTTLFKALLEQPGFVGPTFRKGVHYFDLNPDKPLDWYRSRFPTQSSVERVAQRQGHPVVIGESSPYYMWHPLAPERIATALPEVKVIALLRDPVARAYSAHAHELARGFETEPFERALELEAERLDGEEERLRSGAIARSLAHQHLAYVRRGQYIDQLERLEAALGRERILVVDSVALWSSPEEEWPEVTRFLGLPDHPVSIERHNARSRSPLDDALRERLEEHFVPYDERLAAWWGRTPSWR